VKSYAVDGADYVDGSWVQEESSDPKRKFTTTTLARNRYRPLPIFGTGNRHWKPVSV